MLDFLYLNRILMLCLNIIGSTNYKYLGVDSLIGCTYIYTLSIVSTLYLFVGIVNNSHEP